jgi:hypothetical protein
MSRPTWRRHSCLQRRDSSRRSSGLDIPSQQAPRRVWALVAVGTAVSRCPPHRPVLALLTHTVLTSDVGMLGVKAQVRIRLEDLDRRKQGSEPIAKALPSEPMALATPP